MEVEKQVYGPRKTSSLAGQAIQPALTAMGLVKQVGSPTIGTSRECLRICRAIQKKGFFDGISTPSMVMLAEDDTAVRNATCLSLARRLKHAKEAKKNRSRNTYS